MITAVSDGFQVGNYLIRGSPFETNEGIWTFSHLFHTPIAANQGVRVWLEPKTFQLNQELAPIAEAKMAEIRQKNPKAFDGLGVGLREIIAPDVRRSLWWPSLKFWRAYYSTALATHENLNFYLTNGQTIREKYGHRVLPLETSPFPMRPQVACVLLTKSSRRTADSLEWISVQRSGRMAVAANQYHISIVDGIKLTETDLALTTARQLSLWDDVILTQGVDELSLDQMSEDFLAELANNAELLGIFLDLDRLQPCLPCKTVTDRSAKEILTNAQRHTPKDAWETRQRTARPFTPKAIAEFLRDPKIEMPVVGQLALILALIELFDNEEVDRAFS